MYIQFTSCVYWAVVTFNQLLAFRVYLNKLIAISKFYEDARANTKSKINKQINKQRKEKRKMKLLWEMSLLSALIFPRLTLGPDMQTFYVEVEQLRTTIMKKS